MALFKYLVLGQNFIMALPMFGNISESQRGKYEMHVPLPQTRKGDLILVHALSHNSDSVFEVGRNFKAIGRVPTVCYSRVDNGTSVRERKNMANCDSI